MQNFPLIVTIVGIAGSAFLLYFGFRGWKRFKLITGTETSRISGILGGLVEINGKEYAKCGVDDDTGTMVVDLEKADLVLDRDAHARTGLFSAAPPELGETLNSRYGRSSKGFIFNRRMRYSETVLEVGDEIYVLGDVTVTGGGEWRITKREHPLIVSDKGEQGATRRYKWQAILSWAGAIVVAVVIYYFLRGSGVL